MALPTISGLWTLGRQVQDLLRLQARTEDTFAAISDRLSSVEKALGERLRKVEDRPTRLETEQHQVVTEARSAATGAASMITGGMISDAITRVTRVEEGLRRLEHRSPDATRALRGDG
jgi:hypothetical protein